MKGLFSTRLALRAAHAILDDHPVAASYFVTNRCNYKCRFCDYPTFNTDRTTELSAQAVGKMAQRLADCGVVMLSIIGGEPFIRQDLVEAVRAASHHLLVQVTTNGWFIDEARARDIYEAGVYQVNVSLDSPDAAVHNEGRQNPRAYDRAIRALERLRDAPKIAHDQKVCIESILSARNLGDVEQLVDLAEQLGVHIVFQPYSAGHVAVEEMRACDAGDVSARLTELAREHPCILNNRPMLEQLSEYFRSGSVSGCGAGRTIFNIDSAGYITRCEEQRRRYGCAPLHEMSRREIYRALDHVVDDTWLDGCGSCYLRTRGETEPLYGDNLEHFVDRAREMFRVELPAAIPRLARLPGAREASRGLLGGVAAVERLARTITSAV